MEVVSMLNSMYSIFDRLTELNGVYKVGCRAPSKNPPTYQTEMNNSHSPNSVRWRPLVMLTWPWEGPPSKMSFMPPARVIWQWTWLMLFKIWLIRLQVFNPKTIFSPSSFRLVSLFQLASITIAPCIFLSYCVSSVVRPTEGISAISLYAILQSWKRFNGTLIFLFPPEKEEDQYFSRFSKNVLRVYIINIHNPDNKSALIIESLIQIEEFTSLNDWWCFLQAFHKSPVMTWINLSQNRATSEHQSRRSLGCCCSGRRWTQNAALLYAMNTTSSISLFLVVVLFSGLVNNFLSFLFLANVGLFGDSVNTGKRR